MMIQKLSAFSPRLFSLCVVLLVLLSVSSVYAGESEEMCKKALGNERTRCVQALNMAQAALEPKLWGALKGCLGKGDVIGRDQMVACTTPEIDAAMRTHFMKKSMSAPSPRPQAPPLPAKLKVEVDRICAKASSDKRKEGCSKALRMLHPALSAQSWTEVTSCLDKLKSMEPSKTEACLTDDVKKQLEAHMLANSSVPSILDQLPKGPASTTAPQAPPQAPLKK